MKNIKEILTTVDHELEISTRADEIDIKTENALMREIVSALKDTLKQEFPGQDLDMLFDEFYKRSKHKYDEIVTTYPYCKEVLLELKRRGIKLGVITNKERTMAFHCLDVIGLGDGIFDYLVGYNDVTNHKPHPEGIFKAMNYFKVDDKKKVLYVGDNKLDVQTADNAEIDSTLVTWGPRKMPEDLKPTYKIDDYRKLLGVIENE